VRFNQARVTTHLGERPAAIDRPLGARPRACLARSRPGRTAASKQLPDYDPSLGGARRVRVLPFELDAATLAALHRQAKATHTGIHGALGAAQLLAINAQFPGVGPRTRGLNSLATCVARWLAD
jgi:hypothetical protein